MSQEQIPTKQQPHVLFVDDSELADPARLRELFEPAGIASRLRHPESTNRSDLEWADLVVVDYFLSNWSERDECDSVARAPFDGLAVASTMRSALLPVLTDRTPGVVPDRTVAFALWSSNLKEASFDLPAVVLPHVFSRENNLEWAFRRSDVEGGDGVRQIAVLARAVCELPHSWPTNRSGAEHQLFAMLGIYEVEESTYWMLDAKSDVLGCRPPMHELSARSHGLVLLRWLLHRIFPYPCFLLDEQQLRARLRVDSLTGGTVANVGLLESLDPYVYTGVLSEFAGRRWWRAGVENWLFNETSGESGNPRAVLAVALRGGATVRGQWLRPVIVINGDLERETEFFEVEATVRIRPDDWPVYADDAYALRSAAAADPALAALVDIADRDLIDRNY